MYDIIDIKSNKKYRLLDLNTGNLKIVDRAECLYMAQKGLLHNAKSSDGIKLTGVGCNLRVLNYSKSITTNNSTVSRQLVANAIEEWVYEQEGRDLIHYIDTLKAPINSILYRGSIMHKSMLEVGKVMYLKSGLVSWSTTQGTALEFASQHLSDAKKDAFDLSDNVDMFVKVVYCIKGSRILGVDIPKVVNQFSNLIDREVIELAEDEQEILIYSNSQPMLKIIKVEQIDKDTFKLYCNLQ